jgi:hypothetical protein
MPRPGPRQRQRAYESLGQLGRSSLQALEAEGYCAKDGLLPHEFGVFVRSAEQLNRAQAAAEAAGVAFKTLDDNVETSTGHVSIGTMHLAKGLEFRAVAVMACDDEIIPLQVRQIRTQADRLLSTLVTDVDGNADDRDTISMFNGPPPTIAHVRRSSCRRPRFPRSGP